MTIQHPASLIPFYELNWQIGEAVSEGLVNRQSKSFGFGKWINLYCYSKECVYSKSWTEITKICRGLITSPDERRVVAFSFPKFFNYGEINAEFPNEPYKIYDKLDGSLIIAYWYSNKWNFATKGSFNSIQAIEAEGLALSNKNYFENMTPGYTYLFEYVGPRNKIVVKYPENKLILLGIYDSSGIEIDIETSSLPKANLYSHSDLNKLLQDSKFWPHQEEGRVIKFESGYRLKIKGDDYKRIHAALNRLTPLHVWELMAENNEKAQEFKKLLPEEFWNDFDSIYAILNNYLNSAINITYKNYLLYKEYTDKDLGLILHTFEPLVAKLAFVWRKFNGSKETLLSNPKARLAIFNSFRPKNNVLIGYEPSFGLKTIQEEDV